MMFVRKNLRGPLLLTAAEQMRPGKTTGWPLRSLSLLILSFERCLGEGDSNLKVPKSLTSFLSSSLAEA